MSTSVPLLIGPVVPSGIAKITGPILLGELFNWCLYGVLIVQVSLYSYYFPFDKWAIKVLVYSVFVAETVQTILTGIDICYWFAAGFGNIERLSTTYIAPLDTPMFGALIAFVVQSSFCYRIWALQKSLLWWCLIIEVVSLAQCIGGIGGGVEGFILGNFTEAHDAVVFVYVWLVGSAIADISIAITMSYLLARVLKRNIRASMRQAMRRLMYMTVETNIVSATVATMALIMFAAAPKDVYWYCPMAIIGKIYSNTLLASFNNRILFRENRTNHVRDQSVHAPLLFPEALAPRRSMDTPRVHIRTFNEEFISGKSVGSILPTQHTLHRAPSEPGTSVAPSTRKPSALLPLASRSSSPALVPSDPPTPPTPPTLLGSSDMGSEVIPLMQPSAYRHGIRPLPTLPADVGGRRVSFGVHQGYDAEV